MLRRSHLSAGHKLSPRSEWSRIENTVTRASEEKIEACAKKPAEFLALPGSVVAGEGGVNV